MQTELRNCFWVVLLFILASCQQEKRAQTIPIEDFFNNPQRTAYQISPDGNYISFLQPYKNIMNVFVQSVDGKTVTRVSNETDLNISFYFWANNNEIVYMKNGGKRKNPNLFAVSREGENFRQLFAEEKVRLKVINANNVINNQLLIALNKRDSTIFDAYRLDIATGKLEIAEKNPGNIIQWIADEEGKLRLAIASDGVNETLLFRNTESGPFKPIITNNFKSKISPVGFTGRRMNSIYAVSNHNRDKAALVEIDCSTGKERRVIYSNDSVDVTDAGFLPHQYRLLYAGYETWKKKRHYLDEPMKAIFEHIEKLLPDNEIRITGQDTAGQKFVIRTFTDKSPGAFYLYTRHDRKLTKLSDINPALSPERMSSMEPVAFKASDGLTINGYLTVPLGYKAEKLPVVVIPHGGPSSRNSWGFNSEVQFLASRGYAVFQVNFRGSKGYGKEFWIAGFQKWGSDIQQDITSGVHWLIEKGIADKKRIAIYGSGFGGYSAMYGLCFHPELYKCGISQSGFVNLFTYIKAVPPYYKPMLQMYYEMVGNPENDIEHFRAISPVFHADKIKAPVMVAVDIKDPRVNVNETNQFVKELKNRKVPITYLVRETKQGNFDTPEIQMDFYRQLELFLNENLKN